MVAPWKRLGQALRDAGIDVTDVWQLVRTRAPYPAAIPILTRWAAEFIDIEPQSPERDRLLEGIVRALSVPEARPAAAPTLVELFPKTTGPLQWIVGNAIEVTASTNESDRILDLVSEERYGTSRQMLVLTIRRIAKRNSRTIPIVLRCVEDDTISVQAMSVLASLDPALAVATIELKVHHPDPAIAAAARKALKSARAKIDRGRA